MSERITRRALFGTVLALGGGAVAISAFNANAQQAPGNGTPGTGPSPVATLRATNRPRTTATVPPVSTPIDAPPTVRPTDRPRTTATVAPVPTQIGAPPTVRPTARPRTTSPAAPTPTATAPTTGATPIA